MPRQDGVSCAILRQVPWSEFERLRAVHGADRDARGSSAESRLVALPHARLAGASSLRAVEDPPLHAAQAARAVAMPSLPFARLIRADLTRRRPLDAPLPPRATRPVGPAHPSLAPRKP